MIVKSGPRPVASPIAPPRESGSPARAVAPRLLLADVRRDMAAIFGEQQAPRMQPPSRTRQYSAAHLRDATPPPRRGAATTGPVLCAALAGLLLGMTVIGVSGLIERIGQPATRSIMTTAAGVAESPFEKRMAGLPVPPSAHPASRTAAPVKVALMDKAEPAPAKAGPVPATTGRGTGNCEGDRLERQWCMRHDILEADRRLRRAYAKAIDKGIERPVLIAHQRSWTRLRERAARNPDAVITGYRNLTEDLERLAIHGRHSARI